MNNTNVKATKFFSGLKKVLDTNAPTFATFGSILGVGLTVYFMHKASKQAAKVEEKYEETIEDLEDYAADENGDPLNEDELKQEKTRLKIDKYMRLVYIYRWALLSGIGSAGFAVLSNYLNGRTIAGLTTLLALNQDKLQKGCEKVKELVGEDKFKELQESVEKDILGERVAKGEIKPEKRKKAPAIGKADGPEEGLTRFYIPFTDEFWDLPEGRVKDSIAEASRLEYLNWNDFRNMNGYASCQIGYDYCWDKDHPFKAHIGYVNVGAYGTKSINFDNQPIIDMYGK